MKIAIAGYGLEGEANYNYWNQPGNELTVVDESDNPSHHIPSGTKTILGGGAFNQLNDFDLVIRTAGLNPGKITTSGKIWSSTNEFFDKCPAPIIGVTGSKGKGTTASLIASILKESGYKVHLVGNIGVSGLDVLSDIKSSDIVVYELSSFQLWDIEKSPHIAVVLFIEPEHLDVHDSLDDYISAKSRIVKFQSDIDKVIYNKANSYASDIAGQSAAKKVPYQDDRYAHVSDNWFWYGEQKLCSIDSLKLVGKHNLDNACAAINASMDYVNDVNKIESGLSKFEGLPHRLKFVKEVAGIKYYDDSIATTPGSALAAIKAFEQPKVLILGGSSKGADFSELSREIVKSNVRGVVLIGQEANKIQLSLLNEDFEPIVNLGLNASMVEIIDSANQMAQPGDVIILTPSCASFDMFKNYEDRGDQFIEAVNKLAN